MADYYTVEQGDHLSKIAKDNGFTDYTVIWDHPNNADLKKKRQNPNILLPGDQVFIPDMEQKQESGATDKRHTFTVDKKTLKLRLVLEDIYEKPIAGAQCALLIDGQTYQLTTDGNGKLDLLVGNDYGDLLMILGNGDGTFRPYQRAGRNVALAVADGIGWTW